MPHSAFLVDDAEKVGRPDTVTDRRGREHHDDYTPDDHTETMGVETTVKSKVTIK